MKTPFILLSLLALSPAITNAGKVVDERLQTYQSEGAKTFEAAAGKAMWTQEFAQTDGSKARACSSCHTTDMHQAGKHITTGKPIEAMSPSVNPQRLTDAAKIEKWFVRNCKWTMGRECTAQEKGDFLKYIQSQ
ncbi:MAG TPA: DUF1924 domain-containing protein [Gammaproteobacteria bacterium]